MARALRWVAIGLLVLTAAVFVARALVGDVYRVTSPSMNPTLWGDPETGDFVLVTFGGTDELARFDLVVLRRDGEPEPYVKRVVGLPNESVQVRGGDLYVDGELLGLGAWRPAPIPVFDLELHALDELFGSPDPGAWVVGSTLRLTAAPGPDELSAPLATLHPILDDHLDPRGRPVGGLVEANDLVLDVAFVLPEAEDACGALQLELSEKGDRFRLDVRWAGRRAELMLSRRAGEAEPHELARTTVGLEPGSVPLRLANVDNGLWVAVAGARVLAVRYDENRPIAERPGPTPRHLKPRVSLRGRAKPGLELTELRVLRDLVYTSQGDHGTREPVVLGPDEVFLLGDSSPKSRDGRAWGPVSRDALLGRPRAVVWPPERLRLLPAFD